MIVSFLYTARLRKRERAKYLAYMHRLNGQRQVIVVAQPAVPVQTIIGPEETFVIEEEEQTATDPEPKRSLVIPKETEERLLNGLGEMEAENVYLENNITLPYIASQLKTNTKYLSAIINKHKEKDFSSYINEWRILYIIDRLQQNPQYRQFKIAHLAEECGFSSHSKFTAAFKQVTGISPSAFISNLQKDQHA
jgi:AraC-like DNA-binding protein